MELLISKLILTFSKRIQERSLRKKYKKSTPKGIRIPVTSVKGKCPKPLDDGGLTNNYILIKKISFVNFLFRFNVI